MKQKYLMLSIALTALCSCSENDFNQTRYADNQIRFSVEMAETWSNATATRALSEMNDAEPVAIESNYPKQLYLHTYVQPMTSGTTMTRGSLVNSPSGISSFAVSGYRYGNGNALTDQTANFFYHETVSDVGGNWDANTAYYWPATGEQLAFYAYTPVMTGSGDGVTTVYGNGMTANDKAPLKLSYKVPAAISDQQDLMVAKSLGNSFAPGTPVTLPFDHALTAVGFMLGSDVSPEYVESVWIENIADQGDYTVDGGWSNLSGTAKWQIDFKGSVSSDGFPTTVTQKTMTDFAQDSVLLLIPQTFTTDQQRLVMKIKAPENTYELRYPLNGTSWTKGTKVTYAFSTSKINIVRGTVSYPTTWDTETFALKSTYDTNESIGVYAVDNTTGEIKVANMRLTYDGTNWNTSGNDTLKYKSSWTYYAYYPYRANDGSGRTKGATYTGTGTDEDFFSGIISNWTILSDQSTQANFLASDLLICKGANATDGIFTHMSFPMRHALGLAVLNLPTKSFTGDVTFYLYNDDNYTWDSNGTVTATIVASHRVTGKGLYKVNTRKYYYIVTPDVSTTFTCSDTGIENMWNPISTSLTLNSGKAGSPSITMTTGMTKAEGEWETAVGDVYFTDGALAKTSSVYPSRTPAGIIYEIDGRSGSAEYMAGYTHGYAMGIWDADDNIKWYQNTSTDQPNSLFPNLQPYYTTSFAIGLAAVRTELNGYAKYNYLKGSANNDAFSAIRDYAASNTLSTGYYYLPAIGEFCSMMESFDILEPGYNEAINPPSYTSVYYQNVGIATNNNLNNYIEARVGSGNYTYISHTTKRPTEAFWSSSEFTNSQALLYSFDGDVNYESRAKSSTDNANFTYHARPFIVF